MATPSLILSAVSPVTVSVPNDTDAPPQGIIAQMTSVIPARFQGRLCAEPALPIDAARQLWTLYQSRYKGRLPALLAVMVDSADDDSQSLAATEITALERGCLWACVLTSAFVTAPHPHLCHSLLVIEAQPYEEADGDAVAAINRTTGRRHCWHVLTVLDLDGPEPDWEALQAESGAS